MTLEYEKIDLRAGHSRFAVASVCMAAAVFLFISSAGFFGITPFNSRGNEKEEKVAVVAAILGMLLAVRAMQDFRHRQILAVIGFVLNGLAIPAAAILLPYTLLKHSVASLGPIE